MSTYWTGQLLDLLQKNLVRSLTPKSTNDDK